MNFIYTEHILNRLILRRIKRDLPKEIFIEAQERYYDTETGYLIAVKAEEIYNRQRDVAVTYLEEGPDIKLVTIHPLKEGQKESRVKTGRWRKV